MKSVIATALVGSAFIAVVFYLCLVKERDEMPESYRAWVKQTGNPKSLDYKEWRALIRIRQSNDDTVVVPVPMIIPQ